jgi:hypothetical protein
MDYKQHIYTVGICVTKKTLQGFKDTKNYSIIYSGIKTKYESSMEWYYGYIKHWLK